jgi:phosphoribosylformylglycinamidine synthase
MEYTSMKPKALILAARGTNRDMDAAEALNIAGADAEIVPLNFLKASKRHFEEFQILVVAGGFSYADALGAGKLLALDLNAYFSDEIKAFVEARKPVIGICNGFQALVKSGILPGKTASIGQPNGLRDGSSTLTFNVTGHFECRWVTLQPISQKCVWTRGLQEMIECPIAHGEGNFQVSDPILINQLVSNDQVALTYVKSDGEPAGGEYPINPNGSVMDIAGICNPAGNVLGLMPHPENHIYSYQHLRRTRGVLSGSGIPLFVNGVKYAAHL